MRRETETKVDGRESAESLKQKNHFNNVKKKKIKTNRMILELKFILILLFLNKISYRISHQYLEVDSNLEKKNSKNIYVY